MKEGFKSFAYYLIIPAFLSVIFNNKVIKYPLLTNILFYLILLLFFIFISRKEIIKHFNDFKNNLKKYLLFILKWVIIGLGLMIISNYIIQIFIDVLPTNEISNRELIKNSPIISLIYLLIIAPFLEEYVFRFSFKNIKNYYIYILITCILFSSLHILSIQSLAEIWYFIPYFIIIIINIYLH